MPVYQMNARLILMFTFSDCSHKHAYMLHNLFSGQQMYQKMALFDKILELKLPNAKWKRLKL